MTCKLQDPGKHVENSSQRLCTWISSENSTGFSIASLDLTSSQGLGSQHHLSGPLCRSSHGFPRDLDGIKGQTPTRAYYRGFPDSIPPWVHRVHFYLGCTFLFYLAQAHSSELVSPSLFTFTLSDKLCHCLLYLSFISLFQMREPGIQRQRGEQPRTQQHLTGETLL